jgi:phage recombination protein Bet
MATDSQALTALELPESVTKRGINEAQWRTLRHSLYPGADPLSVLLVIDYCAARKLDPLKKPCHIVPMEVKDPKSGKYEWRDVVLPGIYEYRTTAARTGQYLGHSKAVYGPDVEYKGVKAPEWCALTAYRKVQRDTAEFPVEIYFREVVAVKGDGKVNARWSRAPRQMLTKCAEAAALREAFPEEFGGVLTADEVEDQRHPDIMPSTVNHVHAGVAGLAKLPEALAETVEKTLAAIGLSPAQRLVKLDEYLATDPEDGAQKLLAWCAAARAKPVQDNGKGKQLVGGAGASSQPAQIVPQTSGVTVAPSVSSVDLF